MYAHIVKNDEGTWDIWAGWSDIPIPERKARLDNALESGLPIVGQDLTQYGISVRSGSVWNGTEWTGGDWTNRTEDDNSGLFAYVCDNTVVSMVVTPANNPTYEQIQSIFESENTIIKLPEGMTAKTGDIWDGEKVISI